MKRFRPILSRVFLSGFVFSLALFAMSDGRLETTAVAQQTPSCPSCPPAVPRVIYTPLIELNGSSYTEINLNCRSSQPIEVVPTFYKADGTEVLGDVIMLQPSEMRFADVRTLIPEPHRNQHNWGGMTLSYLGAPMTVWAQLTFHDVDHGGSVNSFFTVMEAASSTTRSAVWKAPGNSDAFIGLGNYSNTPATSTLTFSNGDSETILIPAFGTSIVTRRNNGNRRTPIDAESVTITSTGEGGKVIPMGYVSRQSFVSSIRFADTENISQPNIYSTNLRLKNTVPNIVLRNTSNSAITATPKFFPTGDNTSSPVELAQISIPANGVKQVNLTPLINAAANRSDLDAVSVHITSSGGNGSLVGAANFKNIQSGVEYDIPLRDSGQTRNAAGAYPVRLDDDYTTILSITNVGEQPGKFIMQVNYDNGSVYAMYPKTLAPGESAIFDFRKIRNEQIPDSSGRLLPPNLSRGQIKWGIVGAPVTRLIGRSEIISRNGEVSSSYSCGQCCPPSVFSGRVNPLTEILSVGESKSFQGIQTDVDCHNNPYSPYPVQAFWDTMESDIGTVSGNGITAIGYGVGAGTTTFTASWDGTSWLADINDLCIPETVPITEQTDVVVAPTITDVTPNKGLVGNYVDVTITGSGFEVGENSIPAMSGITVTEVYYASASQITARFTIAQNATGGNRAVKVTVKGVTSTSSVNFFVQIPSKLSRSASPQIVVLDPTPGLVYDGYGQEFPGGPRCGAYRNFKYDLLDQAGNIIEPEVEVRELLSNIVVTPTNGANPPTAETTNSVSGSIWDLNGYFGDGGCPTGAFSVSVDQNFKVIIGQTEFLLSTKNQLVGTRNAAGKYTINATTTIP